MARGMGQGMIEDITGNVRRALAEDVGSGDISAALLDPDATATGRTIAREATVSCGRPWVDEVYRQLGLAAAPEWRFDEGEPVAAGSVLYTVRGNARALLTAERSALNFLQLLCGVAAQSRRLADLVAHTGCELLDTRKTLPGLRIAQKYAVRVGGCRNHRLGLHDGYLLKENHIRASGSIAAAISRARALLPDQPVAVEVRDQAELEQAVSADADSVMLDNFSLGQLREAVAWTDGRCKLEASGGISEASLVTVAETGVDHVSLGMLTKHCRAADLSFLLD